MSLSAILLAVYATLSLTSNSHSDLEMKVRNHIAVSHLMKSIGYSKKAAIPSIAHIPTLPCWVCYIRKDAHDEEHFHFDINANLEGEPAREGLVLSNIEFELSIELTP